MLRSLCKMQLTFCFFVISALLQVWAVHSAHSFEAAGQCGATARQYLQGGQGAAACDAALDGQLSNAATMHSPQTPPTLTLLTNGKVFTPEAMVCKRCIQRTLLR